jgi:hypothetical protein
MSPRCIAPTGLLELSSESLCRRGALLQRGSSNFRSSPYVAQCLLQRGSSNFRPSPYVTAGRRANGAPRAFARVPMSPRCIASTGLLELSPESLCRHRHNANGAPRTFARVPMSQPVVAPAGLLELSSESLCGNNALRQRGSSNFRPSPFGTTPRCVSGSPRTFVRVPSPQRCKMLQWGSSNFRSSPYVATAHCVSGSPRTFVRVPLPQPCKCFNGAPRTFARVPMSQPRTTSVGLLELSLESLRRNHALRQRGSSNFRPSPYVATVHYVNGAPRTFARVPMSSRP